MKSIIPKKLFPDKRTTGLVIENTLNECAKAVEADFHTTTHTWQHKPRFQIKRGRGYRRVYTRDKIYTMLNRGTRPHTIRAKRRGGVLVFYRTGFRAKSRVGLIGSRKGRRADKDLTFAKSVRHPGTQAYGWDRAIKKKWDREFPRQLRRAIRASVGR